VKCLIENGAYINAKDKHGNTPLHIAARAGNLRLVKYLVETKGVDINSQNNDGETPLHLADFSGKQSILKCFLEKHCS